MANKLVEGQTYCIPLRYHSKLGGVKNFYMCGTAVKDSEGRVLLKFTGKYATPPDGATVIGRKPMLTGIWAFARELVGGQGLQAYEIPPSP